MQTEFLSVGEKAAQLNEIWMRAHSAIQSVGVSSEATNGRTPGVSLSEANVRMVAALSVIASLSGAAPEKLELIAHKLPSLKASLDLIEPQLNAIASTFDQRQGSSSTDQNGNLLLQLQHPEKGPLSYDLGTPLAAVLQQCNVLLESLPYVAYVLNDEGIPVFAGLTRAASEQLALAKDAALQATKELSAGKSAVTALNKLSANATLLVTQIQEQLTAVTSNKAVVDTSSAEVEQKLARTREISKDADTLQQRVTGFLSQFEAFDSQMKARLEQFSEFDTSTKEAERLNAERETKISELVNKADTMIRGATTAGLSKSLDDAKDAYEIRLHETQKYFLISAGVLLLCTLPIAAQIIPGPWQQFFIHPASGPATESGLWLAAVGKLILVIPATWATAFFASNYAELFHLSREYAHKAALAKAIDGFRREAPEYSQEIVGSVFMEIQDNPGSRKSPSPATPQNPITKKFLEKVLDAIRAFKGAA